MVKMLNYIYILCCVYFTTIKKQSQCATWIIMMIIIYRIPTRYSMKPWEVLITLLILRRRNRGSEWLSNCLKLIKPEIKPGFEVRSFWPGSSYSRALPSLFSVPQPHPLQRLGSKDFVSLTENYQQKAVSLPSLVKSCFWHTFGVAWG